MSDDFDPYHIWLQIPPKEQPPHHYRLLGLALFEPNAAVIEGGADQRMAHVRTFQNGPHSALSQKILNEIANAKLCLLQPKKKAEYDLTLRSTLHPVKVRSLSPTGIPKAIAIEVVPTSSAYSPQRKPKLKKTSNRYLTTGLPVALVLVVLLVLMALQRPRGPQDVVRTEPTPPKSVSNTSGHRGPSNPISDETSRDANIRNTAGKPAPPLPVDRPRAESLPVEAAAVEPVDVNAPEAEMAADEPEPEMAADEPEPKLELDGSKAKKAAPKKEVKDQVSLTDLTPTEKRSHPMLKTPPSFNKVERPTFISTHPVGLSGSNSKAFIKYALEGDFAEFRGAVGIPDGITPQSPVTFRILGDHKVLWESKHHTGGIAAEGFVAIIRGVRELEIQAESVSSHVYAHGTWIDPLLIVDPARAKQYHSKVEAREKLVSQLTGKYALQVGRQKAQEVYLHPDLTVVANGIQVGNWSVDASQKSKQLLLEMGSQSGIFQFKGGVLQGGFGSEKCVLRKVSDKRGG